MVGEQHALASMKLGFEDLKRVTNSTYDNAVLATAKYGSACKDLMDDPAERWKYWTAKEMQAEQQMKQPKVR